MEIPCVSCRQSLPLGATFCNACGRPVDADRDGIPDALGNMIAAKARAIVAEERRAEEEREADAQRQGELTNLVAEASKVELELAANARLPRTWLGSVAHGIRVITFSVLAGWLIFGVPLHLFVFGLIGRSPAGLLCPLQCDGCEAPGRVFASNYKGSWQSNKGRMGYALVCHHEAHDIETLTYFDVRSDPLNTELQPYIIHGITTFFAEGLILAVTLGVGFGVGNAGKRLRKWELQRKLLLTSQRTLAERRAALGEAVQDVATFRG